MKQRKRGSHHREPQFIDADFADALSGNETGGGNHSDSARRQAERKTQQFCRQVQRALNAALADGVASAAELYVEEVLPAPDCGRLIVRIAPAAGEDGQPFAEAIATLGADAPRLRAEVARAITRKRAPELYFVPALPEEGGGEDE